MRQGRGQTLVSKLNTKKKKLGPKSGNLIQDVHNVTFVPWIVKYFFLFHIDYLIQILS